MRMRVLVLWVALLLLLIALLVPGLALATMSGDPDTIPTFDAFLEKLSGPLVSAGVGIVLSWLIEYWAGYGNLRPKFKRLVFFGLCLILPMAAALLRAGLGYVRLTFDPLLWHAIWSGAGAGGVATVMHIRRKVP